MGRRVKQHDEQGWETVEVAVVVLVVVVDVVAAVVIVVSVAVMTEADGVVHLLLL